MRGPRSLSGGPSPLVLFVLTPTGIPTMAKYVYFFGGTKAEGRADMKNLLGGKGANLAEMVNIGLPVPAGFTLTTEVCNYYDANSHKFPAGVKPEVEAAMKKTEEVVGAK